uniref:Uncharacterized protein n=1 Tax=Caenorhabditis japonica TaxID=281687 RepID=A0A8R1ED13_CAEJA
MLTHRTAQALPLLITTCSRTCNDPKKSDVENWLVSYCASKKPEFWRTGTMSLQNRWHTVVDKESKYY